jgi:hypothetical protein
MKRAGIVCGAIGVGAFTLWVFPGLAYVSITAYGAPASAFVLLGYGLWRLLASRWPAAATPFLVAFAAPIAFVLLGFAISVPLLMVSIIAPTVIVEVVRQRPWKPKAI